MPLTPQLKKFFVTVRFKLKCINFCALYFRDRGRKMVEKLKESLPRQQFLIAIQAAVAGTSKILARENIPALRKDVTAKCYGGDFSRQKKLLDKQKEGKKKMRSIGNIEISKDVFVKMIKNKW